MLLKNQVEIEEWLDKYNIFDYKLISDEEYGYVVNVNNDVNLSGQELKSIDVKFNIIEGHFDCCNNNLQSLNGCPEIVNGYLACSYNQLKTLDFAPKIIKKHFYCGDNLLTFKSLNKLFDIDFTNNYISLENNKELGELQKINDINEVKKILSIYKEKENFMKLLEVTDKSVIKKNRKC